MLGHYCILGPTLDSVDSVDCCQEGGVAQKCGGGKKETRKTQLNIKICDSSGHGYFELPFVHICFHWDFGTPLKSWIILCTP